MLHIFISDFLIEFSDDTKLCCLANAWDARGRCQKALDRLENWVVDKGKKLNKDKCQVLCLGKKCISRDWEMTDKVVALLRWITD